MPKKRCLNKNLKILKYLIAFKKKIVIPIKEISNEFSVLNFQHNFAHNCGFHWMLGFFILNEFIKEWSFRYNFILLCNN